MKSFLLLLPLLVLTVLPVRANMGGRIYDATQILEKKQGSNSPIPAELLSHARGVAIFTVTKGGLGLGGLGGEGVVVVRHESLPGTPSWRAPIAFNIAGASIGAQIGFSKIRYILILNTDDAVRLFTSPGKVAFDATATGTAGNDTGIENESTIDLEKRSVIVFRESAGVFGGATLGGSSIEVQDEINHAAYGEHMFVRDILNGKVLPPAVAKRLYQLLDGAR